MDINKVIQIKIKGKGKVNNNHNNNLPNIREAAVLEAIDNKPFKAWHVT